MMGGLPTILATAKALSCIVINSQFESAVWLDMPACPAHLVSLQIQSADLGADDLSALCVYLFRTLGLLVDLFAALLLLINPFASWGLVASMSYMAHTYHVTDYAHLTVNTCLSVLAFKR